MSNPRPKPTQENLEARDTTTGRMVPKALPRGNLGDALKAAVKNPKPDPRLAEIAYIFIHLSGGPEGFARELWKEYSSASTGGIVRARIIDTILRCLKIANDQTHKGSEPVSLMSDEDLERRISELLGNGQEEAKS